MAKKTQNRKRNTPVSPNADAAATLQSTAEEQTQTAAGAAPTQEPGTEPPPAGQEAQPEVADARRARRRAGDLTYEDVARKADELLKHGKGKPPSCRDVLNVTGGSMSTVYLHMQVWRERLFDQMGLSDDVPEPVLQALLKWRETAVLRSWTGLTE